MRNTVYVESFMLYEKVHVHNLANFGCLPLYTISTSAYIASYKNLLDCLNCTTLLKNCHHESYIYQWSNLEQSQQHTELNVMYNRFAKISIILSALPKGETFIPLTVV